MNTEKWTTRIDKVNSDFKTTFGKLTIEQLNWKPNEAMWSIAQNIDHLIVINETYYPVMKELREGKYKTPFMGKLSFMVNFLGNTILKAVQPDRKKKMKTFPIWEPTKSKITEDIWLKFDKHQSELKQLIIGSSSLLDKDTVISSPANRNIVYKLETAFDIITTHEQRHLEQAKEILSMML